MTDESDRPVKVNVIVLCNTHTREMFLSLPAAAVHLLLLCAAPLLTPLCHCSAAQVQLVWLCNHWVRLHLLHLACAAPQAAPLAWLGFKSSNFLCLLSWCGLGTLAWVDLLEISGIFHKID